LLKPLIDEYEIIGPISLTEVTTPLNIVVYGEGLSDANQLSLNVGEHKRNTPFVISPRYLLTHEGVSSAQTMAEGWGSEFALIPLAPEKIEDDVYLVKNDDVHAGLYLGEGNLSASYMTDQKMAVLANQGMNGEFWYWEASREIGPANYGFGLNNPFTILTPYCCVNAGLLEVGPSMSINALTGIWRNLVFQQNIPFDVASNEIYGFAVDYRSTTPTVYAIAQDSVIAEISMPDFLTTSIYPMIYGNRQGGARTNRANFGKQPFTNNAEQALIDYGVDVSEFKQGWGIYAELEY